MTDPIRAALERLVTAYDTNEGLLIEEWLQIARTALAQPAPPAEGEVGELVAWLREEADDWSQANPRGYQGERLARAAIALDRSRRAPVPVSERLPGMEDCDAEGCIWLWDTDRRWVRQRREAASSNTWVGSSWLPGYALPLPAGEVEP